MKQQNISRKILPVALSVILALGLMPDTVQAAVSVPNAGSVSDGVDFDSLSKPGNGIYYGTYKHVTASADITAVTYGFPTAWEDSPTPILWDVMGEEKMKERSPC